MLSDDPAAPVKRRNHYFVETPDSIALYSELIRGLACEAATLEISISGTPKRHPGDLLDLLAPHTSSVEAGEHNRTTHVYSLTAEVRAILTNTRDGFRSYPADFALIRADGSPILDSICAHSSVSVRLSDDEYAAWHSVTSRELLACLDAPDPGKVRAIGPFLHAQHDADRIRATLATWTPIESTTTRHRVANYLEGGTLVMWGPDTVDIFDPHQPLVLGDQVLTDGVWAWCREAAHYARHYGTGIDQAAIDHIAAQNFVAPAIDDDHVHAISGFLWNRYVGPTG